MVWRVYEAPTAAAAALRAAVSCCRYLKVRWTKTADDLQNWILEMSHRLIKVIRNYQQFSNVDTYQKQTVDCDYNYPGTKYAVDSGHFYLK